MLTIRALISHEDVVYSTSDMEPTERLFIGNGWIA